ncbi:hypothetical protein C0Q70_16768 [Pomacea canaliculata]|uniref:rRNA-processing protein UTP23 homolog n=1 Tax=Pomacea canaliculata TaxID=400727 RepID=A0A2T7NQR5_POMCA|nr:rRNA-processing protein UTP23 homolog [Pomacea canaliculata]XP_025109587.1 rRNA-processing protein UTP23 homolog [Pomacea canaliculata]PVD23496.1 hypothetical protein C0Q70_16768 [Pomacea canaliculata]
MKVKRYKHAKRTMMFYKNNFSITPPFHVLVDGTFCKAALKFQVNIQDQLPKYLGGEVRLYTTRCCLNECEAFGSLLYGPLKVLQQYNVAKCNHRPPVGPPQCLAKVLAKSQLALTKSQSSSSSSSPSKNAQDTDHKRYLLATQDPELSEISRSMVAVPLLYISFNAINLESPSDSTKLAASNAPDPTLQQERLKELLKKENLLPEEKKKKKKKIKGPNPLSCKKKKKPTVTQNNSITGKKSRHKKKISGKLKIEQAQRIKAIQRIEAGAGDTS